MALTHLSGCEQFQRTAQEEILKSDPAFASILTKKAELDTQIRSLEANLAEKRREVGDRMRALQREYRVHAAEVSREIRDLQSQLDPERREVEEVIAALKAELRIKQQTSRHLLRVQRDTEQLLEKSDADLTAEGRASWEDKLAATNQELASLSAAIADLKVRLHILYLKLRALRQ